MASSILSVDYPLLQTAVLMTPQTSAAGSALSSATSGVASSASSVISSATPTPTHHTHHGLSGGKIAGIAVGCVIGGLLILGLLGFCCFKTMFKKGNKRSEHHEQYQPPTETYEKQHQPRMNTPAMERADPVASGQYHNQVAATGVTPEGVSRNTVPRGVNASDVPGDPRAMARDTGAIEPTGRTGAPDYNKLDAYDHGSGVLTSQAAQATSTGLGDTGNVPSGGYHGVSNYVNTHGGVGNMAKDAYSQAQKYGVRNP